MLCSLLKFNLNIINYRVLECVCVCVCVSNKVTPVGWGSTYCFTAVGVGVTPITKDLLLKSFLGGKFLFPRSLAFDFCYDLDIWGQG